MKAKTITISVGAVYGEIDSLTYKYADASSVPEPKVENAMQSDTQETLDGHIMGRNVEFRDARLRQLIQYALADEEVLAADDTLESRTEIVYDLNVEDSFRDAMLKPLTTYIHRYLAWGALFDWYAAGLGSAQAQVYQRELDELEREIQNILRSDNVVKRPAQPWGPLIRKGNFI